MTQPWKNDPLWPGATVAVLASGPSMSAEVAEALREHRTIAVNEAIRVAPWADMMLALDANWPQSYREFEGMRLTGVEDESLDAFYIGPRWERVRMSAGCELEIHNSGLAAIRIAAQMGASRIVLAGFDPEKPGHFHEGEVFEYQGLAEGLRQITAELTARGVSVERFELPQPAAPLPPDTDEEPAGRRAKKR